MGKRLANRRVSAAMCILAVVASFSATASTVAGFVNLGTYEATEINANVGIWCGLLMYLHVFLGLLTFGTTHLFAAGMYLLSNALCLGVSIYGAIKAFDIYEAFKEYSDYLTDTDGKYECALSVYSCVCRVVGTVENIAFENAFRVSQCNLYDFGEKVWLVIFILVISCGAWAIIGLGFGLVAIILSKNAKMDIGLEDQSYEVYGEKNTGFRRD